MVAPTFRFAQEMCDLDVILVVLSAGHDLYPVNYLVLYQYSASGGKLRLSSEKKIRHAASMKRKKTKASNRKNKIIRANRKSEIMSEIIVENESFCLKSQNDLLTLNINEEAQNLFSANRLTSYVLNHACPCWTSEHLNCVFSWKALCIRAKVSMKNCERMFKKFIADMQA